MLNIMETTLNTIIYIFLFMAGASVFSFLNVVAYRMPLKKSFVSGRDYCPNCNHQLKTLDLIPVLSYLCIKGKCRYCGKRISPRYFLMEIFGGAMLILAYLNTKTIAELLTVFAFISVLTVVALIDIETMEIPDVFHVILLGIGIISIFTMPGISLLSRGIGIVCISVPMLLMAVVRPGAFGGGDIKLMAACGVLLGTANSLLAAFIAILTGGIYGAMLLISKKKGRKEHFAFGPFLCIGMILAVFFGNVIINWYMQFFTV